MEKRKRWLQILTQATCEDIKTLHTSCKNLPEYSFVRPPESGLAMVRGKASGAEFNMGEMTITRCAVSIAGVTGIGYIAGRDKQHAESVAVFDGFFQTIDDNSRRELLHPLEKAQEERQARQARETDTSRVNFFTMVRGD